MNKAIIIALFCVTLISSQAAVAANVGHTTSAYGSCMFLCYQSNKFSRKDEFDKCHKICKDLKGCK